MMHNVIQTEGLTKQYGSHCAVNQITLKVGQGEIYGFLGLNGAGKTTTIRMLLGMIRPDKGASYVLGNRVNAGSHSVWAQVGYMVETPYSYPELTVVENLEIVRRLRRLPDNRSVDEVIERLQLTPYRNKKAKQLSLGNGQRLGLAKALIHKPPLLILDEPTNGLDPAGIVEVRQLLQSLAADHGVTIFISSHLLGEVAKLATRIGIIHQGRLLQEANAREITSLLHKRLLVQTREPEEARKRLVQAGRAASLLPDGLLAVTDDSGIAGPEQVARELVHSGHPPLMLRVEEEDLEAYFLRVIQSKGVKA